MPENQNEIEENANLTPEQRQQYERLMVEIEERERKRETKANRYAIISAVGSTLNFCLNFFVYLSAIGKDKISTNSAVNQIVISNGLLFFIALRGFLIKKTNMTRAMFFISAFLFGLGLLGTHFLTSFVGMFQYM